MGAPLTLRTTLLPLAPAVLLAAASAAAPPVSWEPRGPGGGGALFSPSLSPHQPGEMYVACDMSELFHTTDMGRTWTQADHRVIQGNRASQVWYTNDPMILYTIDHSTRNLIDLRQPVRSNDGGQTWQPLPGDPTGAQAFAMLADPFDFNRVFVVDNPNPNPSNLWFSDDGGNSFRNVYTDTTGGGCYLAGIFTDGALVFIGTNAGLLVSTDGGASFLLNPGIAGIDFSSRGEGMTGFAGGKEGGQIRLLCVTSFQGDVYLDMYGSDYWSYMGVYTLDWGQPAWIRRTNGLPVEAYPFYAGMARGEIDTMWIAGGDDSSNPIVYRSINGGQFWANSFLTTGNANIATGWSGEGGDRGWSYGECALGFCASPVDPRRAVITDFGFVHVTDDGGITWRQAYVDPSTQNPAGSPTPRRRYYSSVSLENTTSWWLTWVDAQTIVGCYSDIRGTRSEDGGLTWGFDYSGHTSNSMYHCVKHPDSGTLYAATSNIHDMYQSTRLTDGTLDPGTGTVRFSVDDGSTWQLMRDFGDIVMWLALDPNDPNTLYASVVNSGVGGIYVSNDIQLGAGSSWRRLAVPPRTEGHPFNIHVLADGALVATYSGRRWTPDPVNIPLYFTPSSGVFVSTDAGVSWLDRSDPGMHYWTKDLVVDPADATQSTWYVGVFSGWGGPPNGLGGLYRTLNRGLSWQRVNAVDRVTSLGIDPTNPEHAYMTTEVDGLWYTENLSAPIPAFTQVAEYPFRQPERVLFNPYDPTEIWVTSFGNGLRVGINSAAPPPDLLRNTMVTSLAPLSPILASFMPLAAPRDFYIGGVSPPMVDPDPSIVGDPTRPLVFYLLTSPSELRLSLSPARQVALSWTVR